MRAHRGHAAGSLGWGGSAEAPCVSHRAIDDKYSRREEYRGFTQDFKEKDGYKPDVKIEYVDETGRKLTPKEVSGAAPWSLGQGTVVSIAWGHSGPPLQAWQEGVFACLPPPQQPPELSAGGSCSPFSAHILGVCCPLAHPSLSSGAPRGCQARGHLPAPSQPHHPHLGSAGTGEPPPFPAPRAPVALTVFCPGRRLSGSCPTASMERAPAK